MSRPTTISESQRSLRDVVWGVGETMAGQWVVILALIFGGCCRCARVPSAGKLVQRTDGPYSNAWTLEMATAQNPRAGSLITFAQFVLVTLFGIRKRFTTIAPVPPSSSSSSSSPPKRPSTLTRLKHLRLKPLAVPIRRWLIQVILFLAVSLLNNAAFGYKIPMAVHIVFRSGGLVVNMILGWLTMGRRYRITQVLAVLLISFGIAAATFSATKPDAPARMEATSASASAATSGTPSLRDFGIGILLLTLALILSALLGFSQEKTNARYGRGHWEEGMFFLHFLALPMFAFVGGDLAEQVRVANASPPLDPVYALVSVLPSPDNAFLGGSSHTRGWLQQLLLEQLGKLMARLPPPGSLTIPSFWVPLVLNIVTQLVCVNGVNRLTSRVSSLSVTLVLALRKAVSLVISVVWIGGSGGSTQLWAGSAAVLVGTVMYTLGSGPPKAKKENKVE